MNFCSHLCKLPTCMFIEWLENYSMNMNRYLRTLNRAGIANSQIFALAYPSFNIVSAILIGCQQNFNTLLPLTFAK